MGREAEKKELIEQEKERLLREHEEILKTYYAKGYLRSMNTLNR